MFIFALIPIEAVNGRRSLFKLRRGNRCFLDDFEKDVINNKQHKVELTKLYSYMEYLADGITLPDSIHKELRSNKKDSVKEYELRTRNLRLYLIKQLGGRIVVYGGYKKNQQKDLKNFRAIKKQFVQYLKDSKRT